MSAHQAIVQSSLFQGLDPTDHVYLPQNNHQRKSREDSPDRSETSHTRPVKNPEKRLCFNDRTPIYKPSADRDRIVLAPYNYVAGLPSKKERETLIQNLNKWFKVPTPGFEIITSIISTLHQTSLMFDDIEANSMLRRGTPAAHMLYGTTQTINSAVFALVNAFSTVQRLASRRQLKIL
ncbi:isoprenoid synthase domain-containing protein [Aspergillus aurantiobrunneus]